jgi:hypothetical protein
VPQFHQIIHKVVTHTQHLLDDLLSNWWSKIDLNLKDNMATRRPGYPFISCSEGLCSREEVAQAAREAKRAQEQTEIESRTANRRLQSRSKIQLATKRALNTLRESVVIEPAEHATTAKGRPVRRSARFETLNYCRLVERYSSFVIISFSAQLSR